MESCFHCGGEIPAGTIIEESGAAGAVTFCCRGCHGAYLLIAGAGLQEFYRRREWDGAGLAHDAFQETYSDSYLSRFVYAADGGGAIDIIIGGIRCASCVWLNEKIISGIEGVREARVNYATGRARVTFDPALVTAARIFSRISALGYSPRPYTASAASDSARAERNDLLVRFGTAFFLTMQLMAYSFALYAGYFQGMELASRSYLQLFSLLVTTPVVFYCGWPFLAGAWRGIANRALNMELLIAVGSLSSWCYSIYAMNSGGEVYFETAAMIVTLILAGRLLENGARRQAAAGVERLLTLCQGEAHRFQGEQLEAVDPAELRVGDLILVPAGQRFPVDGRIVEGSTDVDESIATGEPLPVEKQMGAAVMAGSINLTGGVRVRCEREVADSFVMRVARLVEEAQARRAPIQGMADRIGGFFVPAVIALAAATFCFGYLAGGSLEGSIMTALSVMVIACPCALGLATPTAMLAGTGAAASIGIIFKGGDVLERLSRVTVATFDKTGTLTYGRPKVVALRPASGIDPEDLLGAAASVESGAPHPIGRCIVQHAASQGIPVRPGVQLQTVAGGGVAGTVAGEEIAVGSAEFLSRRRGPDIPAAPDGIPDGGTAVFVSRAGRLLGAIVLEDEIRREAAALVSYFGRSGIRSVLLSGDRRIAAETLAARAGIAAAMGGLSPGDKACWIEGRRTEGETVLMVGDGINDAPALSAADVGCAVAGGSDIAIESSDLVLVRPDLERVGAAHRIARHTMAVVRQNLVWAFLYNAVGIPLAMAGKLTPVYAAAAMALSSLCVVGNSLRLKYTVERKQKGSL